jgi:hypothetical protein
VKLTYLTLIVFLLFSCGKKHRGEQSTSLLSNFLSITDNEDKSIKEIINFYRGYCEYSIGTTISTDNGTKKYFELKLSKSEVLEKFSNSPDVMASNMAYLFYKNLKGENKKYNEIHSVLIFDKKEKYEAIYSRDQLELISAKMYVLNKVLDLTKTKNFIGLKPILSDDSYSENAKNQLITNLQKVDPTFGNFKGFTLFGFRYETLNGFSVLDIFGVINRDKQNNEFTLKVDLKASEDKVHFLDYNFPLN